MWPKLQRVVRGPPPDSSWTVKGRAHAIELPRQRHRPDWGSYEDVENVTLKAETARGFPPMSTVRLVA
jgi:hypothetical protein